MEFVKLYGGQHFYLGANNEFIRCFHQFVSLILSTNFTQFTAVEKEIILNQYSLTKFVDSEFESDEFVKTFLLTAY